MSLQAHSPPWPFGVLAITQQPSPWDPKWITSSSMPSLSIRAKVSFCETHANSCDYAVHSSELSCEDATVEPLEGMCTFESSGAYTLDLTMETSFGRFCFRRTSTDMPFHEGYRGESTGAQEETGGYMIQSKTIELTSKTGGHGAPSTYSIEMELTIIF